MKRRSKYPPVDPSQAVALCNAIAEANVHAMKLLARSNTPETDLSEVYGALSRAQAVWSSIVDARTFDKIAA